MLLCLLFQAPQVWSQNLVTNGGFETGDFSGWTQFGSNGQTAVVASGTDGIAAPDGSSFYARAGPNTVGGIFQNLSTVIGETYRLTYALHAGLDTRATRAFLAQVGTLGSLTTLEALTNPALFAFQSRSFVFTASSSTTRLEFSWENRQDFWRLDSISLRHQETHAVPELDPGQKAPLALLLGILLLLADRRRRSLALTFAP